MRVPNQCAPVERQLPMAGASQAPGIDPSFNWGGLLKTVAQTALPLAAQVVGSL